MFLEEQFDVCEGFGSSLGINYAVQHISTKAGNEYAQLIHPYQVLTVDLEFNNKQEQIFVDQILDLFNRSNGTYGGFRFPYRMDFSTNDYTDVPTFADQLCVLLAARQYQITRWYGFEGEATASRRRIRKPRAGTVLVGIRDVSSDGYDVQLTNGWSVDNTTGIITFAANNQKSISNISQAAQAVITVGAAHGYSINDTVYISGVTGMVQINSIRATVVNVSGTTITVDVNSTGFDAYSSDGVINTEPQDSEEVTAGCYFDIPMRFETNLSAQFVSRSGPNLILTSGIQFIERLNPA